MSDLLAEIAQGLIQTLPEAPEGMRWESNVWRDVDDLKYTFHATWRLVPTITNEDTA